MGITTPASFKSLMVVLISAFPPGMQYYFWFIIFPSGRSINGFHLAFSTIISSYHGSGNLLALSISISAMHPGTGGARGNTGWVWGPLHLLHDKPELKFTDHLTSIRLFSGGPQWHFGSFRICVSLESVSNAPPKVCLFLVLRAHLSWWKAIDAFEEGRRKD